MKGLNGLVVTAIAVIGMFLLAGVGYVIALGALAAIGYVVAVSKMFDLSEGKNKGASIFHLIVAVVIFCSITWWMLKSTGTYHRFAG